MQGKISSGELVTETASEIQVAELLGTTKVGSVVFATEYPTKHEVEELGIKNVVKKADWGE